MKGQFLVISSIVISAILLGTATAVNEIRSEEISAQNVDREVQNVKDLVKMVNLTEQDQRSALEEVLSRENFRVQTTYNQSENCMNVTIIDTNSRFSLGCLEGSTPAAGDEPLALQILNDRDFENYGRYERTSVDRTLEPGNVGLGYRSGERSITGLEQGLIGYWRFEKSSGSYKDYSQYSNPATPSGTFSDDSGVFGTRSVSMDGSTSKVIEVDEDNWKHPNRTITVSIWAKVDDYSSDYTSFVEGDYLQRWYIGTHTFGQQFRFMLATEAASPVARNVETFNEDEWNHLAFTYDYSYNGGTAANWTLYRNGRMIQTNDLSSQCGAPGSEGCEIENVIRGLCIMNSEPCVNFANNPNPLDGSVDELRVYDRALEPSEIEQLYIMGRDGTFDGTYNAEALGIAGEEIQDIEVDTSLPGTDTEATMEVRDSGGSVTQFDLSDGTRNYSLGGYTAGRNTRLLFEFESGSETLTPVIDNIKFWRSN